MSVARSSGTSGQSVLADDCTTAWTVPGGVTGPNAQLIVDLGCSTKVENILLRNLETGRGTKDFLLYVSVAEDGPWTLMLNGTLEPTSNTVSFD